MQRKVSGLRKTMLSYNSTERILARSDRIISTEKFQLYVVIEVSVLPYLRQDGEDGLSTVYAMDNIEPCASIGRNNAK